MTMFATMLRRIHPDGRTETIGEPEAPSLSYRTIGQADREVPGWGWIFECTHEDLCARYGPSCKILRPVEERGPGVKWADRHIGIIADLEPDGRYELLLIECY